MRGNTSNRETYLQELERQWNEIIVKIAQSLLKKNRKDVSKVTPENAPYILEEESKNLLKGKAHWILLTSPSGAGKTTFGKALEANGLKRLPRVRTRKKRPGESSRDYHFVSKEQFEQLVKKGAFLWYIIDPDIQAENRGIFKKDFEDMIKSGEKFYIDAGIETARQFPHVPEVAKTNFLFIFLLPPSFRTLRERLEERVKKEQTKIKKGQTKKGEGSMTLETVDLRLKLAVQQLEQSQNEVNYYVVNDRLETIPQKAKKIVSFLD